MAISSRHHHGELSPPTIPGPFAHFSCHGAPGFHHGQRNVAQVSASSINVTRCRSGDQTPGWFGGARPQRASKGDPKVVTTVGGGPVWVGIPGRDW